MPGLSNYPPGVSGNEPQIAGEEEKLFLVCECGEAFDTIEDAWEHLEVDGDEDHDCSFKILPESEAM
jgi:hypothetical protein